jgi:hypothetical protein
MAVPKLFLIILIAIFIGVIIYYSGIRVCFVNL